jgi:hypothetical protein
MYWKLEEMEGVSLSRMHSAFLASQVLLDPPVCMLLVAFIGRRDYDRVTRLCKFLSASESSIHVERGSNFLIWE